MSTLSAGEHEDEVDFVSILDGFGEFIRVGAGMVEIDFDDVMKFIFFGKDGFFHSWKLLDEMVQTFPNRISLHGHNLLTVGIPTMGRMNMNFDGHVLFLLLIRDKG